MDFNENVIFYDFERSLHSLYNVVVIVTGVCGHDDLLSLADVENILNLPGARRRSVFAVVVHVVMSTTSATVTVPVALFQSGVRRLTIAHLKKKLAFSECFKRFLDVSSKI